MRILKKLTAFFMIALLMIQFALITSAEEEEYINLKVDPENKTLTVSGKINKDEKFLLGMLLYNTDEYNADNSVEPISILDTRTNASGEFKFDSIIFGEGSYLKMLTALIDTGDEIVKEETVIAFEDSTDSDSIAGFSNAVSQLTEEQIKNYYNVLVDFSGYELINDDGSYASEIYAKLVEKQKEAELPELLKSDVGDCTTKTAFRNAIKEHLAILAVKYLDVEDIYKALFEEIGVSVNSSTSSEKEKAVSNIKGTEYTSISKIEEAINAEITSIRNGSETNSGSSDVPSGSYTPSFSGGGSTPPKKENETTQVVVPSTPQTTEKSYTDISGHWSEADVKALTNAKIINGYPDDTFRPDDNVTRAEAASIIMKAFCYTDSDNENEFSDVSKTDWYYSPINTLYQSGIMKGNGEGFKPNNHLTREDLCVLIYRCLNNSEKSERNSFNDQNEISDYALDAVNYLSERNIIQGYENNFMPKAFITRGQICAIINRTLKAVKD